MTGHTQLAPTRGASPRGLQSLQRPQVCLLAQLSGHLSVCPAGAPSCFQDPWTEFSKMPPAPCAAPGPRHCTECRVQPCTQPSPMCPLTAESPALATSCPPPTRSNGPTCRRSLGGRAEGCLGTMLLHPGVGGDGGREDEDLTQTLPFIFKVGYKTQPKEQWGNMQGPRRKDGVCGAGCEHSVASFPTFSGAGYW